MARVGFWSRVRRGKSGADFAPATPEPVKPLAITVSPPPRRWPGVRRTATASAAADEPSTAEPSTEASTDTSSTDSTSSSDTGSPTAETEASSTDEATDSGRAKLRLPKLPRLPRLPRPTPASTKLAERVDDHLDLLQAERPGNDLDLPPNAGEMAILQQGPTRGVLEIDVLAVMQKAAGARYDPTDEAIARILYAPPQMDSPIDHFLQGPPPPPTEYLENRRPAPPPQARTRAVTQNGWRIRGAMAVPRHPRRPTRTGGGGGPIIRG